MIDKKVVRIGSCLLKLAATARHSFADVTAHSARVCLGALAASGQVLRVTSSAVSLDVSETTDVSRDLAFELALKSEFLYRLAECRLLLSGEISRALVRLDFERCENLLCAWTTDAVNRREADVEALVVRNGDA